MKTILSLASLTILVFLGFVQYVQAHTDVSVTYAEIMINTNDQLIILDVREESEYCGSSGHIPGALNYPWSSGVLEARYDELPVDGEILVVCQSGYRSNLAADFLDAQGFTDIYDMLEGMSEWSGNTVGCIDSDGDGFNDDLDNCPDDGNPIQEDEDGDGIGTVCDNCPETYNPNQEDIDIDGIGDVCDDATMCKGDFDYDQDVDGSDAALFKEHFGRSGFSNPCPQDGPAPVEKTWQTICYDDNGFVIPCDNTGQDGEYQKGVVWPAPRFTDNEDGTITDNLTGLMWLKDANCIATNYPGFDLPWNR